MERSTDPDAGEKAKGLGRRQFFSRTAAGVMGLAAAAGVSSGLAGCSAKGQEPELKVATFKTDATPPVGGKLAYNRIEQIDDRLSARGIVLLGAGAPIVLAAVDWIGISNAGYDTWRMALAQAAGTSPDRVTVHALHQHDAPGCDFDLEQLFLARGQTVERFDPAFAWQTIKNTVQALQEGLNEPVTVTHMGVGKAKVEKFASTRRLLGPDGNVKHVRYTSTKGRPKLRELPEGLIDPYVQAVSLWSGEQPAAVLTYYATHPQSYYQQGGVSCDTVGIARRMREEETGVFHLHFSGAGGNIGAGKYNDGSHEMRQVLARRLADGIASAQKNTERQPVNAEAVNWRAHPVKLPVEVRRKERVFTEEEIIQNFVDKPNARHARELTWLHRMQGGHKILLSVLELNNSRILHMPGELFVEYQLAAQKMRPDLQVAMAANGDGGPGYIGTRAAYPKGGYEVSYVSRVSPDVEDVLAEGMRYLLQAEDSAVMPSDFTNQKQRLK